MLAMRRAVEGLRLPPAKVLVDGNRLPVLKVPGEAIVKGDAKVPAISAASILAKVHRDRLCNDLHAAWPGYGFATHKGYPTPEHLATLKEHGGHAGPPKVLCAGASGLVRGTVMMDAELLTARDNPLLQRIRKLAGDPTAYRKLGGIWLEGDHLVAAALQRGLSLGELVMTESAWSTRVDWRGWADQAKRVVQVPDAVFRGLSGLESPARIGAVLPLPAAAPLLPDGFTVVLDRLQDAGNVGSILRSAAAFGVQQVLALKGTAALWSPKVLRAGMGAHFGLRLAEGVAVDDLAALRVPMLATSSHAGIVLGQGALPFPCAWVLGHEGQGVDPALLSALPEHRQHSPAGWRGVAQRGCCGSHLPVCEFAAADSVDQAVRPDVSQDGRGDLLDRLVCRTEPGDRAAFHHHFGLANLVAAVLDGGVLAAWPALIADLAQAVRVDRQAETLALVRKQGTRQVAALEVFWNERVVGGLDAMLHGQIQGTWASCRFG